MRNDIPWKRSKDATPATKVENAIRRDSKSNGGNCRYPVGRETDKGSFTRILGDNSPGLVRSTHTNFAGDSLHIYTRTAIAHACTEQVLALLFDHDGNVGPNLARHGLRG